MSREEILARNEKISTAAKATRARRANMKVTTVTLKIANDKIKPEQEEALSRLFLEAKWYYNAALASGLLEKFDYRVKSVTVMTPSGPVTREIKHLGSHVKQSILAGFVASKKSIARSKKQGRRVGRLKYSREVNSVHLKQHGVTYRLDQGKQRVRVQGIPGSLRYLGGKQLVGKEIASSNLVRKSSGYYLMVTCFEDVAPQAPSLPPVGGDFGVATHITLSDEREFNAVFGESERLRRLQRKLSRQVKGSNNYRKTLVLIRREYERMDNRKDNAANQLVAVLSAHEVVVFQDDPLPSWFVRYGKQLQHSILGRVKSRLRALPGDRGVLVPSWVPTTQSCPECPVLTKLSLSERVFVCSGCGYSRSRDVHGAENSLRYFLGTSVVSPLERGVAPVEGVLVSKGKPREQHPLKQETTGLKKKPATGSPPKRRGLQPRP